MSRNNLYVLGGHDIQNFGKTPQEIRESKLLNPDQKNSTGPRESNIRASALSKNPRFSVTNNDDIVQSQFIHDVDNMGDITENKDDEDIFYEPQDLGPEYFTYLQNKFYERNKVQTSDPKTLFDYWKQLKKTNKNKKQPVYAARIDEDMSDSQMKRIAEIEKQKKYESDQLMSIINSDPRDVEFTLKEHCQQKEKDVTMSKFFRVRQKELQKEKKLQDEHDKRNNKEQRQECQNRLYQGKKKAPEYDQDRKKREKLEKKRQKQLDKDEEYQKQKKYEEKKQNRTEYIDKLRKAHKQEKPNDTKYVQQQKLVDFYGFLKADTDQDKLKQYDLPSKDIQIVEQDIDLYFEERAQDMLKLHKQKMGYDTQEVDKIVWVWKNKTNDYEKKKFSLDFEDEEDVKECLMKYITAQKEQEEKRKKEEEEDRQKQEQEYEEKIKKSQDNMDKFANKLSKPKDRLKLGKQILILKKLFPDDQVLRSQLLQQFQDTRLAKFPEEYDVYDSDEENAIKQRQTVEPEHHNLLKTMQKTKQFKEEQIKQLFTQMLDAYEKDKKKEVENNFEENQEQSENDLKLERELNKKAKEFIDIRNKRFDQFDDADDKVDDNDDYEEDKDQKKKEQDSNTLKGFLSKTYNELIKGEHKESMKRNFPHLKYGESKELKKRSYPVSFKRHFFKIVKNYLRGNGEHKKDKQPKLPFWAPGGVRCKIHEKTDCPKNCKYSTQNRTVNELQRDVIAYKQWEKRMFYVNKKLDTAKKKGARKEEIEALEEEKRNIQLKQQAEEITVWVDNRYLKEKQSIMMTFSDAENCTFTPDIRQPREDRTFEKWKNDWGENFKAKAPKIYKLGVLKQTSQLISKGKYLDSYSKLRDTFNIEQIKEHFATEEGRPYKMISKDSMYIVGKEDPEKLKKDMPNENFENPSNIPILIDVHNLVMFLENYEKQIRKAKKETEKMIKEDPFAPENPLHTKSLFLGQSQNFDKSATNTSVQSAMTTYATRRKQVKSFMCPLGEKCPRALEGRWPQSDISSIVPLGAQCEFAHTYTELKFAQELRTKKKMLQTYMKLLDGKKDPQMKAWNPAGGEFKQCKGCGFRCVACKYRQANTAKIQKHIDARKADEAMLTIVKAQEEKRKKEEDDEYEYDRDGKKQKKKKGGALGKFANQMAQQKTQQLNKKQKYLMKKDEKSKNKIKQTKEQEDHQTFKVGQLNKANALYKQERFSDAFRIICKAVEAVKQELETKVEEDKIEDEKWRKTLGLDQEQEITPEIVYQTLNRTNDDPELEAQGHVLYLYAQKREIIGEKKPNVNQFLNIQIEEAYLKIEKRLTDKEKDILLMKEKIEKIENEEEEMQQGLGKTQQDQTGSKRAQKPKIDHSKLCPNLKQYGHCADFEKETQEHIWQHQGWGDLQEKPVQKKCLYAHHPIEIYLEKGEQKINNLNRSIKKTEQEIIVSSKPQSYKPPSAQTAIQDVNTWRNQQIQRELAKPSKQQKKKIDKAHREEIWERDVEDLVMPVHQRPKKQI